MSTGPEYKERHGDFLENKSIPVAYEFQKY